MNFPHILQPEQKIPIARISERLLKLVEVVSTIELAPVLTDDELECLVQVVLSGKR